MTRSMIAAALFILTTGTSFAQSTAAPAAPAAPGATKGSQKDYADHEGNKLRVDFDDAGKVVKATAKAGDRELPVVQIPMKDLSVCIPKANSKKPLCQPLAFMPDGAFFKMGAASCTCYKIGPTLYCYGNTCH